MTETIAFLTGGAGGRIGGHDPMADGGVSAMVTAGALGLDVAP